MPKPKKPTYLCMAVNAIRILKTRGGSSRQAIISCMLSNYGQYVKESTIERFLRNALKKGVETGILIQNKQSFKLGSEAKKQIEKI